MSPLQAGGQTLDKKKPLIEGLLTAILERKEQRPGRQLSDDTVRQTVEHTGPCFLRQIVRHYTHVRLADKQEMHTLAAGIDCCEY
ncbi:hypothetical protein CSK29544_00409 [Cronobacter sakazakii]|nr:hypothetical protein CSK29544_00409 [Cronobacter sakazakii]